MLLELFQVRKNLLCFAPYPDQTFSHPAPEWFFLGRTLKEFFFSSENPFFQGKRLRGLSRFKKPPGSTFLSSEENRKHMQVRAHTLGKACPLSSTANHFLSSLGKGVMPANKLESSCGCQGGLFQVETIREGMVTCIV